jgi:tRNA (Thr-GGU) A37 N-methylase
VGVVRNSAKEPEWIPYNGLRSVLELLPEGLAAAQGLEPGFVWVITWLDQATRSTSRVGSPRGSFASRTPNRPNPVAITLARLLAVEAGRLHVDALDVCDGTPLLDVKPYVRDFDCVFGPAEPAWRRGLTPEGRLARLVRTIERFCGPLTPDLALAARLALAVDRDLDCAVSDPELTWDCRCRLGVAAGIQAVCGASLADPRFLLGPDEQRLRIARAGSSSITYQLRHPLATADAMFTAPDAELFTMD